MVVVMLGFRGRCGGGRRIRHNTRAGFRTNPSGQRISGGKHGGNGQARRSRSIGVGGGIGMKLRRGRSTSASTDNQRENPTGQIHGRGFLRAAQHTPGAASSHEGFAIGPSVKKVDRDGYGTKYLHLQEITCIVPVVLEGDVISDRFVVGKLAGKGSMGAVYQAHDRATGKPVAIKVLAEHDADALRRFDHEIHVLSELAHPHIVQHVAHGVTKKGTPYLVMEWLEGQSLAARLQEQRLTPKDALELATHIASALAAAHARGIVHRDIKPSNVFLVNHSVHAARVLDFGVAQAPISDSRVTRTGGVVGTPGYMAPEQVQGLRQRASPRADVFSLGAVLFECLTGRRAFEGDDVMSILARVLREEAPRVRTFLPDVPEELDTLVAHMLSRVPEARPGNGAQVHRALQQVGRRISKSPHDEPRGSRLHTEFENRLQCVVVAAAIEEIAGGHSTPTLRTTLSPARWDELQRVALRDGATISEFAGGGLLVRLHGSDGLLSRAARCALAVSHIVEGFRIALMTGCADESRELPYADLIGRAIESLGYADRHRGVRGVRLDEITAFLLDSHFEVVGCKDAPRLIEERNDLGSPRRLCELPTPFVGRTRELETLVDFLGESLRDGNAATALVVAHAGMGKSRLGAEALAELRRRIPNLTVAFARAEITSAPHSVLMAVVRSILHITVETSASRIRMGLSRALPGTRDASLALLTQLLVEEGADGSSRRTADQERQTWLDLLGGLVRGRSLLVVLEDAQWADEASMELLHDALAQIDMQPFAVMALARPEIREQRFGLFQRRDVQEMRLGPLSAKACTQFASTFLPDQEELGKNIAAQSEGHPIFLEELIRTAKNDGAPRLTTETLLAVHGPQISQWPTDALQALRLASLVGETFWFGAVMALLGDSGTETELRPLFDQFVTSGIIARRRVSRIPNEVEYMFAQASMRLALLMSWTEDDQRLGKNLAKQWLHQRGIE